MEVKNIMAVIACVILAVRAIYTMENGSVWNAVFDWFCAYTIIFLVR